jgi:hypothetical protein
MSRESENEIDPGRIPTSEQERIYLEEIERDPVRQTERAYFEAKGRQGGHLVKQRAGTVEEARKLQRAARSVGFGFLIR